jgi:hypothetical protein
MKTNTAVIVGIFLFFYAGLTAEEPDVKHHPLIIGAFSEFGKVESGIYQIDDGGEIRHLDDEWVDHFGCFVIKSITVNQRAHLTAGFGGGFQFRKPEQVKRGWSFESHQRKGFFIGPVAELGYDVGDVENPFLKLGIGSFGYKYNPEAKNLGEYLFRTRAYPTLISTGGYSVVNSASAQVQGAKALFNFGNFKFDVLFLTETGLPPLYDFSLAGVANYSIAGGLLNLGAGVHIRSLIDVNPDMEVEEDPNRGGAYFQATDGEWYSADPGVYEQPYNFHNTRFMEDSLEYDRIKAAEWKAKLDTVNNQYAWLNEDQRPPVEFFNGGGTLLMGRIGIDPKKLFETDIFGPEDLKLFGEIAVLGVKDYPVFYENIAERMPVMFGFNVPCFKLLDVLQIQREQFNSPHLNNTFGIGNDNKYAPYTPSATQEAVSKTDFNDITDEDNVKWSVYLEKKLFTALTLRAQFARDHLQLTSSSHYYAGQFGPQEITAGEKDWYWMVQLAWGI